MTASILQPERVVAGFDLAALGGAGHGEPDLLAAKRRAAFRAFESTPWPTHRDEEWRRTDPLRIPIEALARMPDLGGRVGSSADTWDDGFDVVISVTDSGFSIQDRSGLLQQGQVRVAPLAEAAAKFPEVVAEYLQGPALPSPARKFEALNQAFWNVGFLIHVPARAAVPGGILLRYDHRELDGLLLPRMLVVAEAQSEVHIVEHFTSPDHIRFGCVGSREFYVGPGARLQMVSAQEWGRNTFHVGEDWARVARDGRIDWVTLSLGGKLSKMMVGCDVSEPNANAYLSGIFFADGDQHVDQRTLQLHSSPDTYSNLLYKGAVKDRGHSVYQGVIKARPGAIRVDAYQMNNNLILGEGARADSLPGLEIDADDLKCSHGSTMGSLDADQLYYLRTRGLPEVEAQQLMVAGFFEEVISRVPHEYIQERVREHIRQKIS